MATPASVASKTPAATHTSAANPSTARPSPSTLASASTTPASSVPDPEGKTGDSDTSGGFPILIIAAVLAALALVAIVGAGGFVLWRRRRQGVA